MKGGNIAEQGIARRRTKRPSGEMKYVLFLKGEIEGKQYKMKTAEQENAGGSVKISRVGEFWTTLDGHDDSKQKTIPKGKRSASELKNFGGGSKETGTRLAAKATKGPDIWHYKKTVSKGSLQTNISRNRNTRGESPTGGGRTEPLKRAAASLILVSKKLGDATSEVEGTRGSNENRG